MLRTQPRMRQQREPPHEPDSQTLSSSASASTPQPLQRPRQDVTEKHTPYHRSLLPHQYKDDSLSSSQSTIHTDSSSSSLSQSAFDQQYQQRIQSLSASLIKVIESIYNDDSIQLLNRDSVSSSFLTRRIDELLSQSLGNEREQLLSKTLEENGKLASELKLHRKKVHSLEISLLECQRQSDGADRLSQQQLFQLTTTLQHECDSNASLTAMLDETQRIKNECHLRIEQLESDLATVSDHCRDYESRNEQLVNQLERTRVELSTSRKLTENEQEQQLVLQQRVGELEAELTSRADEWSSERALLATTSQQHLGELQSRIDALANDKRYYKSHYVKLNEEMRTLTDKHSATVRELKQAWEVEGQSLLAERNHLTLSLKESQSLVSSLRIELNDAKHGSDEAVTLCQRRYKAKIEQMKINTQEKWRERESELKKEIDLLQNKNVTMIKYMDDSTAKLSLMKQKLLLEREEKALFEKRFHEEKTRFVEEKKHWEHDKNEIDARQRAKEHQLNEKMMEIRAFMEEKIVIERAIDAQRAAVNELNEKLSDASNENEVLKSTIQALEEEKKELSTKHLTDLERKEKERLRLESLLRQLQPQLVANANKLKSLTELLPSIVNELRAIKGEHAKCLSLVNSESMSQSGHYQTVSLLLARIRQQVNDDTSLVSNLTSKNELYFRFFSRVLSIVVNSVPSSESLARAMTAFASVSELPKISSHTLAVLVQTVETSLYAHQQQQTQRLIESEKELRDSKDQVRALELQLANLENESLSSINERDRDIRELQLQIDRLNDELVTGKEKCRLEIELQRNHVDATKEQELSALRIAIESLHNDYNAERRQREQQESEHRAELQRQLFVLLEAERDEAKLAMLRDRVVAIVTAVSAPAFANHSAPSSPRRVEDARYEELALIESMKLQWQQRKVQILGER